MSRNPVAAVILAGLAAGSASAAEPIRYTVRFPAPQTHYAEVEASIPTGGAGQVELAMPVWTPGSYLVREFARNVEAVEAGPHAVAKIRKNRWRVATGGAPSVAVRYRVYCREMGVQTNWVDAGFALLNGAATFLTLADDPGPRPHEVTIVPPPAWANSVTGLPEVPGGAAHRYLAADFDTLVDSPIYVGNPAVYQFEVDGKPHFLVNEGEAGVWDGPTSARDVEAIVREEAKFWGGLPYDKYVFFNLLTESGGGLEHKNSTVLMASRWATKRRKDYLNWLQLVAHEFFHTWNVKRLRPAELGPFEYESEVTSKSLWIAEGLTSYYDRLLIRRAGLSTEAEYLQGDPPPPGAEGLPDRPKGDIARLQETPGRLVQPLESASFDAWIKFYRRDENTPNTAISYYTKGAVVGFLLDAEIRRATDGKKSLDDAMRLAYARYSGEQGYTPGEFRAVASEVAGVDLAGWFVRALETTDELDYAPALAWFGLRFRSEEPPKDGKKKAWLGLTTQFEAGKFTVTQVKRGTPGFAAGFNVGDEILAIGDERVRSDNWSTRMEQYSPGESASILIARRDRLARLDAMFGVEPGPAWELEVDPKADEAAKARRAAWLGGVSR